MPTVLYIAVIGWCVLVNALIMWACWQRFGLKRFTSGAERRRSKLRLVRGSKR